MYTYSSVPAYDDYEQDPYAAEDTVSYYSDEDDVPQEFPAYTSSPVQQPVMYSDPYDTEPYSSDVEEEMTSVPVSRTAMLIPHYFSDEDEY